MRRIKQKRSGGFILIIALWTLGFLSLLAGTLGLGIRERIGLLSRLESRNKLQLLAESGIRKAIALLNQDIVHNQAQFTLQAKEFRLNNALQFEAIHLKGGKVTISYEYSDGIGFPALKRFGLVDEESKLNVNLASEAVLRSLIKNVLGFNDPQAHALAQAIVDWREYTQGALRGFYEENYYENLEDPYPTKKSKIEMIDELLLIKGVDQKIFEKLSRYLTVYGDGRVNINTVSRPVLVALGVSEELADKIFLARRGKDDIEATFDDYVFQKTFDIASELQSFLKLTDSEVSMIDELNQQQILDTNSKIYSIYSMGSIVSSSDTKVIHCVFNTQASKVEYWREE